MNYEYIYFKVGSSRTQEVAILKNFGVVGLKKCFQGNHPIRSAIYKIEMADGINSDVLKDYFEGKDNVEGFNQEKFEEYSNM